MAPPPVKPPAPATNGPAPDETAPIGPPSGLSAIPTQYNSEQTLRQMLRNIGYDEAREDGYRLKGIQLIDTVRQSLQLYGAACPLPPPPSAVSPRAWLILKPSAGP